MHVYIQLICMYTNCIFVLQNYLLFVTDIIKPVAALLSDVDQGPFRVLIIDSIICELTRLF